jgi:hypothetical protein
MNDFPDRYKLYLETIAEANKLNKPIVFDALAAANLTLVTVNFDGEGDSGQINAITAYTKGDAPADVPETELVLHRATQIESDRTVAVTLLNAIETLCYDYLSQCHGGWENDDGSYGTFEFDVVKRTIRLDCNVRFVDSIHHFHNL